ncbi:MAG: LysR substrate-binding domain-containing protein, partial [Litorimonas sp.]
RLAEDGVGIAWVPSRLAHSAIVAGSLVDLSGRLPVAPLEIYIMRRRGNVGPPAAAAWRALTAGG